MEKKRESFDSRCAEARDHVENMGKKTNRRGTKRKK